NNSILRGFVGFEEALQMAEAGGVTELAERLRFDLADALASDVVHVSDFFQRAAVAINEAKAHFDNLPFAFRETGQNAVQFLFEQTVAGSLGWVLSGLVFDEITHVHI